MKALKYIGQILASFVYSNLFSGILYLLVVLPLAYIITLPKLAIVLIILLGAGLIEFLITILTGIGLIPFTWIVKKNGVAFGLSIFIILYNLGRSVWKMWQYISGSDRFLLLALGVIVTIMILQLLYLTIMGLYGFYRDEID